MSTVERKTVIVAEPHEFVLVPQMADLGPRVEAQLGLLEGAGRRCVAPEALAEADTADPGSVVLLVYRDCIAFLEDRLTEGVTPTAALSEWLDRANAHLTCLGTHRKRVFSTSLAQVLEAPEPLREALRETYGCVFRNNAPDAVAPGEAPGALHRFLAANAFLRSPDARRAQAELAAKSWRGTVTAPDRAPDIDAVFAEIAEAGQAQAELRDRVARGTSALEQAQTETRALQGQIEARDAEIADMRARASAEAAAHTALQEQFDRVQGELRTALDRADALEAALETAGAEHDRARAALERQIEERDAEIADMQARHAEAIAAEEARRAEAQKQVDWAQGELRAALMRAEALETALETEGAEHDRARAALQGQIEERDAEIADMQARHAEAIAAEEARRAEAQERLDLTRGKLRKAIARADRMKAQQAERAAKHTAALSALQQKLAAREARLDRTRTRLAGTAAERNGLRDTLRERDDQIAALHASTSWKLTGPLRRLRRLFGKR